MRDITSDPRLSPFSASPLNASAELTPAQALVIAVGEHVLDVRAREGRVELVMSRQASLAKPIAPRASAPAIAVSRWGEAASVLLRTTLPVTPGDEVELRTAVLVLEPGVCMALGKKLTSGGSTLRFIVAETPDRLTGGEALATALVSPDDAQSVLTALRRVAAAALDPASH